MPDVIDRLTGRALSALSILINSIIAPGKTMDHRDFGDESDFDVVGAQVNQTPARTPIEPVIAVAPTDRVVGVLEYGVQVGDFELDHDGSIRPVVPRRGEVNHTWVRVLMGELLIAIGRDPGAPEMIDMPGKLADLLRDMAA